MVDAVDFACARERVPSSRQPISPLGSTAQWLRSQTIVQPRVGYVQVVWLVAIDIYIDTDRETRMYI